MYFITTAIYVILHLVAWYVRTTFLFFKKYFLIKDLETNKDNSSANFIVVSGKKFQALLGIDLNPQTPLSHSVYQVCRKN